MGKNLNNGTIGYYDSNADRYFHLTSRLEMTAPYDHFLSNLEISSRILDAGCGSGRDTKYFLGKGYEVVAFDGSHELAKLASRHAGVPCRTLRFQEVSFNSEFDGVWACASLLHIPRIEMPEILSRLIRALKVGGIMYVSLIEGEGEHTRNDGRLFTFYTAGSFRQIMREVPNALEVEQWKSEDARPKDKPAPWLNFLLKRMQ